MAFGRHPQRPGGGAQHRAVPHTDVAVQDAGGARREMHVAVLAAITETDVNDAAIQVNITNIQGEHLGGAQTGFAEQRHQRLVSLVAQLGSLAHLEQPGTSLSVRSGTLR